MYNILNRGLIIRGPGALMRSVKSDPGDTSYLSTRPHNTRAGVYYFAFTRMTGRSGEIILLSSRPVSVLSVLSRKITMSLTKRPVYNVKKKNSDDNYNVRRNDNIIIICTWQISDAA